MNDSDDPHQQHDEKGDGDDSLSQALAYTFSRGGELNAKELSQMKQAVLDRISQEPTLSGAARARTWPLYSAWAAAAVMAAVLGGLFYMCSTPTRPVAVKTPDNPIAPKPLGAPRHPDNGESPAAGPTLVWKLERTLENAHVDYNFWSAAASPDGKQVVGVSVGYAIIWDFATGKVLFRLKGHKVSSSIRACAYSADSTKVITACDDHTARVWNAADGSALASLEGHSDGVEYGVFSPDGRLALTAGRDDTVKLWDVATAKELKSFDARVTSLAPLHFSPDGKQFVLPGKNSAATVYDTTTLQEVVSIKGNKGGFATFSPDGKHIAASSYTTDVHAWDATGGGEQSFTYQSAKGEQPVVGADSFTTLAFSPDNKWLVIPCKSGKPNDGLRLFNLASGSNIILQDGETDLYQNCALKFSPDGQYLASVGREAYAGGIWSTLDGKKVLDLPGTTFIAFAPDSKHFVRVSDRGNDGLEVYALTVKDEK